MSAPAVLLVDVVLVARNAAATLAAVLDRIPRRQVRSIVVVDNGSTDATAHIAADHGCVVLRQPGEGHGAAAGRAVHHLAVLPLPPDVVVLLAADGSDDAAELGTLVERVRGGADLVIGVRPGDRPPEERLALGLIGLLYRHRFQDLGAYRAIRFPALVALGLCDRGAGWNIEMQVRALTMGLVVDEVELAGGGTAARRGARRQLGSAGRMLFQILRNSTAR